MLRISLSCSDPDWQAKLEDALTTGSEADLLDFHYPQHGHVCEMLATKYNVQFALHRDPLVKTAHFRQHI